MTVTFLALTAFIQAIRLQQGNSSNAVTTTWIQHDLGPNYQSSSKGIPISSMDAHLTQRGE
jgi:hypothetical protein